MLHSRIAALQVVLDRILHYSDHRFDLYNDIILGDDVQLVTVFFFVRFVKLILASPDIIFGMSLMIQI
jgi:hypothetical protein